MAGEETKVGETGIGAKGEEDKPKKDEGGDDTKGARETKGELFIARSTILVEYYCIPVNIYMYALSKGIYIGLCTAFMFFR